jgi:hypothetical protein
MWLQSRSSIMLVSIAILVVGILPMPSEYYMFLRIVVFFSAIASFFWFPLDYLKEKAVMVIISIIYNPLYPIYLHSKSAWVLINILTIWFNFKIYKELKDQGM